MTPHVFTTKVNIGRHLVSPLHVLHMFYTYSPKHMHQCIAMWLDFKFHHLPNRNRIVSVITKTIQFRFGPNRYQFVSVWAQSIYIKEPNRASQKRPPSSLNQIICWTIVFCVLSVCLILWNYWVKIWALRFPAWLNDFYIELFMGLFSSMFEHVFPQSSSFTERLVACCTFVRLLSSVDHKVPIQILSSTLYTSAFSLQWAMLWWSG